MFGFLLSYFPSKVLLPLALWASLMCFLFSLMDDSILLSGFLLVSSIACLVVIASRISDALTVRRLRKSVTMSRRNMSRWELEVMDVGWLVDYLLRLRAGWCTVVMVYPVIAVALCFYFSDHLGQLIPGSDYKSVLGDGGDVDSVVRYPHIVLLVGAFTVITNIYGVLVDAFGVTMGVVIAPVLVSLILNPMLLVALVGRHFLSNRAADHIIMFVVLVVVVPLWLGIFVWGVVSPSSLLDSVLLFGIVGFPVILLIVCSTILVCNLASDIRCIPAKIAKCSIHMQGAMSKLTSFGKLSVLGEGLREKSPYYSHYYSWGRRSMVAGTLSIVAIVIGVFSTCLSLALGMFSRMAFFVFLPCFWMADHAWEIAKRLRQRTFDEVVKQDGRPPILILRSFPDDKLSSKGKLLFRKHTRMFEVVAKWCSLLGPVLMFGRPEEKIAEIGPARIYVTNDTWKDVIIEHMANARLLLIFVGESDSLAWEVRQLTKIGYFHKTVFVFPPLEPSALSRRWGNIRKIFSEAQVKRSLAGFLRSIRTLRIPLDAIDPSSAMLVWYDKGTLRCLSSKRRNRLAYDIAFKLFVEHVREPASVA